MVYSVSFKPHCFAQLRDATEFGACCRRCPGEGSTPSRVTLRLEQRGDRQSVMPHRRPLYRTHTAEKPTKKAEAMEGAHRRSGLREGVGSQGGRGSPLQTETSLMGQKMCPRGELLPPRPPNFNKVPFHTPDMEATAARKGLEGRSGCGEHINFSNLSANIKASGFIFQSRLNPHSSASPKGRLFPRLGPAAAASLLYTLLYWE